MAAEKDQTADKSEKLSFATIVPAPGQVGNAQVIEQTFAATAIETFRNLTPPEHGVLYAATASPYTMMLTVRKNPNPIIVTRLDADLLKELLQSKKLGIAAFTARSSQDIPTGAPFYLNTQQVKFVTAGYSFLSSTIQLHSGKAIEVDGFAANVRRRIKRVQELASKLTA